MSEFKREKRYIVYKIGNPNWNGSCVVVEDDWPEYEIVWKMIQNRVEGKPNIIEQLQADNARLRDFVLLVMRGCENGSVKAQPVMDLSDENAETLELESLYSLAKKRIASTDSSNWLQEQKAQWFRENNERHDEFFTKLMNWINAYPIAVFPEPDFKKAAKVLNDAGMSIDAISAANMRHVLSGLNEMAREAMAEQSESKS